MKTGKNVLMTCYHGSPGTPQEFSLLERQLPSVRLEAVNRKGYPGASIERRQSGSSNFILGYSWGAVEAIAAAADNDKAEGLILVSSYILPSKRPGIVAKSLLKVPVFSDMLLALWARKGVDRLLLDTSYPRPVPEDYRQLKPELKRPSRLRRAVLEKQEPLEAVAANLRAIRNKGIPVHLLYGSDDAVSDEPKQIRVIRQSVEPASVHALPGSGHALIWTNPEETAGFIQSSIRHSRRNM